MNCVAQVSVLNTFNMRKMIGISLTSRTPNSVAPSRIGLPTMFMMFCQRRLPLGVKCLKDERI